MEKVFSFLRNPKASSNRVVSSTLDVHGDK